MDSKVSDIHIRLNSKNLRASAKKGRKVNKSIEENPKIAKLKQSHTFCAKLSKL